MSYKNNIFTDSDLALNEIYKQDCIDFMKKIKNNTIDLIFADPPYNLSNSKFKMDFKVSKGKTLHTDKGKGDHYGKKEFENFTEKGLSECYRILKDSGSIGVAGTYHNIYLTGYLLDKLGFSILNEILWHKTDATPNMSCTRFVADHENFIGARKGHKHTFNYKQMKIMNGGKQMRCIGPRGKTAGGKRVHPTQKPEGLVERIILASSMPGEIVFDPFMGSGTTAVMAKKNKRIFLGTEIDKEYFTLAKKRIKKY